jgi:predicted RNA-binding protein
VPYYIFIINDILVDSNQSVSAEDIADTLIANNIWVFAENTANMKKLKEGDKVLIYIGGRKRKHYTHLIEITRKPKKFRDSNTTYSFTIAQITDSLGLKWMSVCAGIKIVRKFDEPIPIKPLIQKLHFINQKVNYGLNLRAPIVSIGEDDFNYIIAGTGESTRNFENKESVTP